METERRQSGSPSIEARSSRWRLPAIPFPEADRERLVPVRAEGSADEDLLEDATLAIEDYLRARGYRDAEAEHARDERDGMLTITFTVARGARFVVGRDRDSGNSAVPTADLVKLVQIEAASRSCRLRQAVPPSPIRDLYRSRGFTRVTVQNHGQ